jgi:antitoxin HicB
MDYPVTLERDDNDTILVSFPDFPEAHTFGETKDEALARAEDALATVIDAYIKDKRAIPRPSAKRSKFRVMMPALIEAKVRLYASDARRDGREAELARRLDWHTASRSTPREAQSMAGRNSHTWTRSATTAARALDQ